MRPNPTDVPCRRCAVAVPLRIAHTTLGYCEPCALAGQVQPAESRAAAFPGALRT
jgi:hypothetical protein